MPENDFQNSVELADKQGTVFATNQELQNCQACATAPGPRIPLPLSPSAPAKQVLPCLLLPPRGEQKHNQSIASRVLRKLGSAVQEANYKGVGMGFKQPSLKQHTRCHFWKRARSHFVPTRTQGGKDYNYLPLTDEDTMG